MELEIANKVLADSLYIRTVEELAGLERDRIFCRHDMEHFLSVARITLLLCSELQIAADPDTVYTAALLHDIGRIEQYRDGTPHDRAGVQKARVILERVGCEDAMQQRVLSMIGSHRNDCAPPDSLEAVFRRADKQSRLCFSCRAQAECFWSTEKRNMTIEV